MKRNKITYSAATLALALLATACDEQIMEWKPGDPTVEISEIPLQLQEQIALYKPIKDYVAQYQPHLNLAVGMTADLYISDPDYKATVDANFTGVTFGNAMKMGVLMKSNGTLDFTTVDKVLDAMPQGMKLYGHNLLWHTQQQQAYLKALIAPEMVIESDPGNDILNMLSGDASDFEGGTKTGWGSWGNESTSSVTSPGHDSNYCMLLSNPKDASSYNAQAGYDFSTPLEPGVYKVRFYAKSDNPAGELQCAYQNSVTYGSQGGYNTFNVGTSWVLCEHEFEITFDDVNRLLINFGAIAGNYYIDDIEFGLKQDVVETYNYCTNGDFSNGLTGWTLNSGNDETEVIELGGNPSGNKNVLKLTAPAGATNAWDLEVVSPTMPTLAEGKRIRMSFYVKSDAPGKMRCAFDGMSNSYPWMPWLDPNGSWTEAFETSSTWTYVSLEALKYTGGFADGVSEWDIKFDMGYVPGVTYYLDDVRVEEIEEEATEASASRAGVSRASSITYKIKTAEEKKAILLDAMETWIKEVMEHMGDRVDAWDVINEPIADGYNKWRGIDNIFGSNANDGTPDSAPVETTDGGLTLNWANDAGNQHWYWGYYIGKEYAVKAFEFARKYAPNPDVKLFVNDYNLETSPSKLDALIDFVNYIDANGAQVDGIGTQMHVTVGITKEQVDAMFQKLASTGKLVRITELDIAFGVEAGKEITPSAEQLIQQAEAYKMILTSYLTNIPQAQQSAITIWTLTDSKKEHEYWLTGDAPNLFDSSFGRKVAYKGVCDAIAGFDIGAEFSGDAWKGLYTTDGSEE